MHLPTLEILMLLAPFQVLKLYSSVAVVAEVGVLLVTAVQVEVVQVLFLFILECHLVLVLMQLLLEKVVLEDMLSEEIQFIIINMET